MDLGPVYMIRDAGFGQDFTPKLVAALLGLALVLWDWRTQKRLDYLWVLITGTVVWAGAEAFLSVGGIRDMPVRELLGRPIGLPVSYVIQGMGEGAFVAVLGIFLGDRVLCRSRRGRAWGLTAAAMLLIVASTFRSRRLLEGLPASRRDMLDTRGGIALLAMCVLSIVFLVVWRQWRRRGLAMLGMMLLIATVWTLAQVVIGGRWIEVVAPGGGYERATPLVSLFAFAWDVVVEIALVYLPFLAIPVWLRLMRDPTPLPSCAAQEPAITS